MLKKRIDHFFDCNHNIHSPFQAQHQMANHNLMDSFQSQSKKESIPVNMRHYEDQKLIHEYQFSYLEILFLNENKGRNKSSSMIGFRVSKSSFGQVLLVTDLQEIFKQQYALKIITKEKIANSFEQQIIEEIQTQRQLRNTKGVVQLYEIFEDNDCIYLLLDYYNVGDLITYISYYGIIDMKPENILIRKKQQKCEQFKSQSSEELEVSIADFGLAKIIQEK
ncbi:likely protein kinase [Stylonychia lemnae]|uniref:Likely protein kinase n=1 Tax=Stylonychia lemnae TaxID=5949 RepID=A0A078B1A1_STYLE|nr:likely protein kinase [Stylonychia lemnae]|eukprot:CDW88106.1 likely protein kinase [Stylonychia lemnae]